MRARAPARAEVVGSLLKPEKLRDVMRTVYDPGHTALLAAERDKDLTALRQAQDAAVREVVRRQVDAGLDVLTDGELRRFVFVNSFYDASGGLAPSPDPIRFTDAEGNVSEFPGISVVTEEASRHVGVEQLAISTQCGFSSAGEGNLIDEDTQWRKLELVGRVAERVWGR